MKQRRILYLPGLGDNYDFIRRLGLLTWRRRGTNVTLVPMRWRDPRETFERKLGRIQEIIDEDVTPVTLVGESAGGAMAIVATDRFHDQVAATVTLCGMNQGADRVNSHLYRRNPAFSSIMKQSDMIVSRMSEATKKKIIVVYSSKDMTVKPTDTLIDGVQSRDLRTPGHLTSILIALFLRSGHIHALIASLHRALPS